MIRIGNIKNGDKGEYCGRPHRSLPGSPLANPFVMHGGDRDAVCDDYQAWFDERVKFMRELERLEALARKRRCHSFVLLYAR